MTNARNSWLNFGLSRMDPLAITEKFVREAHIGEPLDDATVRQQAQKVLRGMPAGSFGGTWPGPVEAAPVAQEPVRVYLVNTGEIRNDLELYERHDVCPPMCDVEVLYASPPPLEAPQESVPSHLLRWATADLVRRFSVALMEKFAAAQRKYGYRDDWLNPGWMDECREKLMEHLKKGDPRDVAAYCAFLWHHGESTSSQSSLEAPLTEQLITQLATAQGDLMGTNRNPHWEFSSEQLKNFVDALLEAHNG